MRDVKNQNMEEERKDDDKPPCLAKRYKKKI